MIKELKIKKLEIKKKSEDSKEQRNKLNTEASTFANERNSLNIKTKEYLTEAQEYKKKRDEVNINVSKYKELRGTANENANELFNRADSLRKKSNLDRQSIKQIKKQIDQLEFTQQTTVQTPKKEKGLVTKIKDLESEYEVKKKQIDENIVLNNMLEEATKTRMQASEYHDKLSEYAKQAQENHEKMILSFKEAGKTRSSSDVAHKKFVKAQEEADNQHNIFITSQKELRELDKEITILKKKDKDYKNKQEKADFERDAKDIFDKFKDGGKLTMDDLMIIQRSKY